mmetsp:Transcript_9088/g.30289  ORF Transcript_9088/g.30289 Transcript_9088/m.30289 type:complete len:215 (+) Transcript_9088:195-839(+)
MILMLTPPLPMMAPTRPVGTLSWISLVAFLGPFLSTASATSLSPTYAQRFSIRSFFPFPSSVLVVSCAPALRRISSCLARSLSISCCLAASSIARCFRSWSMKYRSRSAGSKELSQSSCSFFLRSRSFSISSCAFFLCSSSFLILASRSAALSTGFAGLSERKSSRSSSSSSSSNSSAWLCSMYCCRSSSSAISPSKSLSSASCPCCPATSCLP